MLCRESSLTISYQILVCQAFFKTFLNFLKFFILSFYLLPLSNFAFRRQLMYHITYDIKLSSIFQNFFKNFLKFLSLSFTFKIAYTQPFGRQLAYHITSDIYLSSIFSNFFRTFSRVLKRLSSGLFKPLFWRGSPQHSLHIITGFLYNVNFFPNFTTNFLSG